ncbi:MAG: hypothetical protein RL226_1037 [Bacteroidota bacterium]
MKKFLLLFSIVSVLLLAFNPTQADFERFVEKAMREKLDGAVSSDKVGDFLQDKLGKLAAGISAELATRQNYYICSVYSFNIGGEKYHYLGIAKMFIPLQSEQPLGL